MFEDIEKTQRQLQGVNTFFEANCRGTLEYPFQFGKSYTAKLIMDKYFITNPNSIICIIVPSKPLVNQWENFLLSFENYKNKLSASIFIYSAHQIIDGNIVKEVDLVIIDEIHKFTSPAYFKIVQGLYITSIKRDLLGLTASFPKGKEKEMLDTYCPVVDYIPYADAIRKGWTSGITEYNLALELSSDDKIRYEKFSDPIREILRDFIGLHKRFHLDGRLMFKNDYELIMACYRGALAEKSNGHKEWIRKDKFIESVSRLKGWHPNLDLDNDLNARTDHAWNPVTLDLRVRQFNSFVETRHSILTDNNVKLTPILELFRKFTVPTLCFNGNINFANKVAFLLNKNVFIDGIFKVAEVFHSKIESGPRIDPDTGDYFRYGPNAKKANSIKQIGSETLKKLIIEDVIQGRTMFISTVKSLREGISIPNLGMIITTAGDTNPITYLQTIGRGMTIDKDNPDKNVKVVNLYFDDFEVIKDGQSKVIPSRDKQKLIQRQSKSENIINWIDDVNDVV